MDEKKLLGEALKVYGLKEEHVFASKVYLEKDEAVIVTQGGKKIRHKKGAGALFTMTETDKTGKPPKPNMVWSKKYNQWVDVESLSQGKL